MMADKDLMTLADAKQWLRDRVDDGAECPCCTQFAKIYKRKLTSSMAYALMLIVKWSPGNKDDYIHIPSFLSTHTTSATVRGGDWAKLVHWEILEAQEGERDDGSSRVGCYRVTELGYKFAAGSVSVPKYVYIYNQRKMRRASDSTEVITIHDAIGDNFSYRELMQPAVS